jgi:hypothetical protein
MSMLYAEFFDASDAEVEQAKMADRELFEKSRDLYREAFSDLRNQIREELGSGPIETDRSTDVMGR